VEKKRVGVVPHTHWDREWYWTFQRFRHRLVELTDFLLEVVERDPKYECYVFDGQTVVLEDYLEIRPENRERLKKLIEADRLLIGPWYILPDEYLVSPEATVRNLLLGHAIAAEFGRAMKTGYLPDPFGHISQMPQILAGFGIDTFIYTRGAGDELDTLGSEWYWDAPDGSRVLAINQPHGYCNACFLGIEDARQAFDSPREYRFNMDKALEMLRAEIDYCARFAKTKYVLMNNGCDHLFPQPELPAIIDEANKRFQDCELFHTSFEQFADLVKAEGADLGVVCRELHDGRHHAILSGIFSSRIYMKQRNHETETLLERWMEPIAAVAAGYGEPYDRGFIWHAWRLLMQNHPHDSIGGCSPDQVHDEMMPRFDQACQIAETLTARGVRAIAKSVDTTFDGVAEKARAMLVFNPIGHALDTVVHTRFKLPLDAGEDPPPVVVRGPGGAVVPFQLSNQAVRGYSSPIPHSRKAWEFDLAFRADALPGFGYSTYCLDFASARRPATLLEAGGSTIGNAFLKVEANANGSLRITDKRTGKVYDQMNLYEDTEDVGDEYDYSPARNSQTISTASEAASVALTATGPVYAELTISHVLRLPKQITEDRLSRSTDMVECPIATKVRVYCGIARVDVETQVGNRAADHRLRAIFPTDLVSDHCYADGHFDVLRRRIQLPKAEDWDQKPVPTHHHRRFVSISDGEYGLAVANRGLPEYEVREDPEGLTIALTLIRACGWLSRHDLLTRRYNAGPAMRTPGAQCLGAQVMRYSIIPHAGVWDEADVHELALAYAVEPRAFECAMAAGEGPKEAAFVSVEPSDLILSALKRAERSDDYVVRLYNTTDKGVDGTISVGLPVTHYAFANLNEEAIVDRERIDGSAFRIVVPPKRIVTLLLGGGA
jgi:mannosylglycerate hydrolase